MTDLDFALEKLASVNEKHGTKPMLNLGELTETLRAQGEVIATLCKHIEVAH